MGMPGLRRLDPIGFTVTGIQETPRFLPRTRIGRGHRLDAIGGQR
jgi:hypothetical protein